MRRINLLFTIGFIVLGIFIFVSCSGEKEARLSDANVPLGFGNELTYGNVRTTSDIFRISDWTTLETKRLPVYKRGVHIDFANLDGEITGELLAAVNKETRDYLEKAGVSLAGNQEPAASALADGRVIFEVNGDIHIGKPNGVSSIVKIGEMEFTQKNLLRFAYESVFVSTAISKIGIATPLVVTENAEDENGNLLKMKVVIFDEGLDLVERAFNYSFRCVTVEWGKDSETITVSFFNGTGGEELGRYPARSLDAVIQEMSRLVPGEAVTIENISNSKLMYCLDESSDCFIPCYVLETEDTVQYVRAVNFFNEEESSKS